MTMVALGAYAAHAATITPSDVKGDRHYLSTQIMPSALVLFARSCICLRTFYSGFSIVRRVIFFHCYSALSMCFGGTHPDISHLYEQ